MQIIVRNSPAFPENNIHILLYSAEFPFPFSSSLSVSDLQSKISQQCAELADINYTEIILASKHIAKDLSLSFMHIKGIKGKRNVG